MPNNPPLSLEYIQLEKLINAIVPIGMITPWPGAESSIPGRDQRYKTDATVFGNWIVCDGRAIERERYRTLYYDVIGTTYGAGNGSTTFNIPDLRGCIPVALDNMGGIAAGVFPGATTLGAKGGEASHTLTAAESGLPAHAHNHNDSQGDGFYTHATAASTFGAASGLNFGFHVITNTANAGPSNASSAHNNVQPYVLMNWIIRVL